MIAPWLELSRAHAPLLMLTAPLFGALAAWASPWPRAGWIAACIAAAAGAVLALDFSARVLSGAAPPLFEEGVALGFDGVAAIGAPMLALLTALVAAAGGLMPARRRIAALRLTLVLCMGAGWIGALLARDFIGLFLAAEIAWLAGVGLTAMGETRGRLNGALRMLVSGGFGAALMLVGVALVQRGAGAATLDDLAFADLPAPDLAGAGVALMLLSLAAKAGAAPLHFWAAAAYGRAGRFGALALGALGATGALLALVRIGAHAVTAPDIAGGVSAMLGGFGAASIVIGSAQAIGARSLQRLAAYGVAVQGGIVLLSAGLGTPAGLAAALVQAAAAAAASLALLSGAAVGGVQALEQLDGLGRRAPLAGLAIMAGALSLMGAPLTLGFLGRWRLIEASVGAAWWWAAGVVILASLAGVFYCGRIVERLYFRRAVVAHFGERSLWRAAFVPALLAAMAAIGVGLAPEWLLAAADAAAARSMGAGA